MNMELIFSLKLKLPITELNRLKNSLSLNYWIFMLKNTVIANGAIPQIIIVIIANTPCALFSPVLQSSPLFMSISDYNVRDIQLSIMYRRVEFQNNLQRMPSIIFFITKFLSNPSDDLLSAIKIRRVTNMIPYASNTKNRDPKF